MKNSCNNVATHSVHSCQYIRAYMKSFKKVDIKTMLIIAITARIKLDYNEVTHTCGKLLMLEIVTPNQAKCKQSSKPLSHTPKHSHYGISQLEK